jgi:hypothetical protein
MNSNLVNRRDLVRTLLSVPAGVALNLPQTSRGRASANAKMRLNVVLHGSFVLEFEQTAGRAYVRIPDVGDAHEYLAGYWGIEQPLPAGANYKLDLPGYTGTTLPPDVSDSSRTDYVVIRKKLALNANKTARNTFDLPFPDRVTTAYAVEFKDAASYQFFANTGLLSKQPTQLPLNLILQYSVDIAATLPDFKTPTYAAWPHLNLHVFAEAPPAPPAVETLIQELRRSLSSRLVLEIQKEIRDKERNRRRQMAAHTVNVFDELKNLYLGLDSLVLTADALDESKLEDAGAPVPEDIEPEEVLSLEERTQVQQSGGTYGGGAHPATCLHLIVTANPS